MFERFGDQARDVVACAEAEAHRLGHHHIGTEHIVLGLLGTDGSSAARALRAAGATLDGCREKAAELVGPPSRGESVVALGFTERAQRALTRADRLSLRRLDAHVEPNHILASLLDVEGTAGQVLRGMSVDVDDLRATVSKMLDGVGDPVEQAAPRPRKDGTPGPRCFACGSPIQDGTPFRIVQSEDDEGRQSPILVIYCRSCGSVLGASPT